MRDAIRVHWLSLKTNEQALKDLEEAEKLRKDGVNEPEAFEGLAVMVNPFPLWMHLWLRMYFRWDPANLSFYRYLRHSNRPSNDPDHPANWFMDKRMFVFFKAQVESNRWERVKYAVKYGLSLNPLSLLRIPRLILDIWNVNVEERENDLKHVSATPTLGMVQSPGDCRKQFYAGLADDLGDDYYN